jgi:uncharacterized protein (TIGR00266 family)
MRYKIFGDTLPAVTIQCEAGESIYTQSGGMSWMTDNFNMETNMRGGLGKGIGRMFSGESLFMATYTAMAPGAEITLASSFPGTILALELDGTREYIAQKSAFLCATPGVELSTHVNRMGAGFFGGEGFIMQRYSGVGLVFVEIDGSLVQKDLMPGETLKVDTGNLAVFDASVTYDVTTVKGFKNVLFGGEGLFLSTVTGPGRVWLQTLSIGELASRISPFVAGKKG